MDNILGYIMQELDELDQDTDVIIVSDHGMLEIDREDDILLNQYLGDIGSEHFRGNGPIIQIDALGDQGLKNMLARKLKKVPNIHIFPSNDRVCSIKEHNHLELLAKSEFKGNIICCDGALIASLKAGITPEKFPNFYVVCIEARQGLKKYFDDDLVRKFGKDIKGIFSVVADPEAIDTARKSGIKMHWMHALFDYEEGKKSFNQISAMMVRAKNHKNGLPGLQTGGNVGTTSWFFGWRILKSEV